jgi:hypothetical protein
MFLADIRDSGNPRSHRTHTRSHTALTGGPLPAPDHFMTHLSITEGARHGGTHVTDAEYRGPNSVMAP